MAGAYNRILRALRAPFNERRRFHQRHIDIPVHGSCSKCHHFHINCLLPHDPTTHTRFRCEHCGHQMFGLGRSTTQYTLASVNTGTMITPHLCVEEQPHQAGSQGETVTVVNAQDVGLHFPTLDHPVSSPANQVAESPAQPRQESIQEPRIHNKRNRLKQWCSTTFPIRAIFQRLSNTVRVARPPAGPAPSTTNNTSVGPSSPPSISQTPPGDPAGEASESITRSEPPSSSSHLDQPGEARRKRLRILRDGKTKQKEGELRSQCFCSQNCFCRSDGSRASNVAYVGGNSQARSHTHMEGTRSPTQPDGPSHTLSGSSSETNRSLPLQGIATTLSFMGHHFDEGTPSSPETSALGAENPQRRSRFSQTPTVDPNGSSITLSDRMTDPTIRNVRRRSPANIYNEITPQVPAESGMAGVFGTIRDGLTSAGLTGGAVQHDENVEPNSISYSRASFGSSPRHDSHVDHGYNAEGTSLQVDGIASEYTAEEASEEDTPTR